MAKVVGRGCGGCGGCDACRRRCPTGPTGSTGGTGPTGPTGSRGPTGPATPTAGDLFSELAVDQSTSSAAFVDLFPGPLNITTSGGEIEILATIAASVSDGATEAFFQVVVDNVALAFGGIGTVLQQAPNASSVTLMKRVNVPAGTHAVNVQWSVEAGLATLFCNPASLPSLYSASIRAREIL